MSIVGPIDPILLSHLSPDTSVAKFRELLFCEARHVGLRPDAIIISSNLHVPDGGIDAQIDATGPLPTDTFIKPGRNSFQLKTGTTFKPWQPSSIRNELLTATGDLASEVKRTLEAEGRYTLVCFGLDLTPEQINDSHALLVGLFAESGFSNTEERVAVLGQCQIAAYFDRYSSLRLSLLGGSDEDFLSVSEWALHAHMSNQVILSEDQEKLINTLREKLLGETKHIRILGEPGIGKTRLVLESVRVEEIASHVLYVQHGARFSKTNLFREFLRETPKYPLVLVLDELSEREMSEVWGHLRNRCGALKIISLDHGPERSHDAEIDIVLAPRLPDATIKQILQSHVGEYADVDRWVTVCEGSPRVAQAIGENLAANPEDILKPPATVPIWERFLYGYTQQLGEDARHVALLMRHIALFSRFGFESPVGHEARYIANIIERSDPALTWQKFQEIVQQMRERRILQGDRTLFIVPWALHIHLWREYWHWYGRGFDFSQTFEHMPRTLHGWFMDMFRFAHDTSAAPIVREILRPDGIYSNRSFLSSDKGTTFLSTLAEADPGSTLSLIEQTFGIWTRDELLAFTEGRQNIVWTLEKIAVWRPTFTRAARMLTKLAITENASNSNNATGTLLGLFAIGPDNAATEASPSERLPILLEMLRSTDPDWKRIGLQVAEAALDASGHRFRIIGPEFQGVKERASLWRPQTYGEWWSEYKAYWNTLVNETRSWPNDLRTEANSAIIESAGHQIRIAKHKETILAVLEQIANDAATDIQRLNSFFIQRERWHREKEDSTTSFRLRRLEGRLTRRSLESRFQRYVLDTTWDEWNDYSPEGELREHTRPKRLISALAKRVAESDEAFNQLLPKIVSSHTQTPALSVFGRGMYAADNKCKRLLPLLECKEGDSQCLGGYLAALKESSIENWQSVFLGLLGKQETAKQGAALTWYSGFNDAVLDASMTAFENGWIEPGVFQHICFGLSWKSLSHDHLLRLFNLLSNRDDSVSTYLLVDLLDQILEHDSWIVDSEFVFRVVTAPIHFADRRGNMHSYHWHKVCEKLVTHDQNKAMPLFDMLLQQMNDNYRLSYDHDTAPLAHSLCKTNPTGAWQIITNHLLSTAPKWRGDLLNWLGGGIGGFDENVPIPPIAEIPTETIIDWIEHDPEGRAAMIAHCAPRSLDDMLGGDLTRALIAKYMHIDGVLSEISANFHSGGYRGPRSQYLRRKRDRFRAWLSQGFDANVSLWIENEIVQLDKDIEQSEIAEEREPWNRP